MNMNTIIKRQQFGKPNILILMPLFDGQGFFALGN